MAAAACRGAAPPKTWAVEAETVEELEESKPAKRAGNYRPWAQLLKRTFGVDVHECPKCKGRMKLVAMVTDPRV